MRPHLRGIRIATTDRRGMRWVSSEWTTSDGGEGFPSAEARGWGATHEQTWLTMRSRKGGLAGKEATDSVAGVWREESS